MDNCLETNKESVGSVGKQGSFKGDGRLKSSL